MKSNYGKIKYLRKTDKIIIAQGLCKSILESLTEHLASAFEFRVNATYALY